MPLTRKHLLYAMLAALALAALSGVAALIFANTESVWRVAGTSLLAAIAAAFMMPMAAWSDKPATRVAGLTGMSIAVTLLLLGALLIWGDFFSYTTRTFLGMVAGTIAGCGLVTITFLKELHTPGWLLAVRAGTVGIAACAACFIISGYMESYTPSAKVMEMFATSMAAFWSVIAAALCLVGWERKDRQWWRWAGVLSAAAATAMVFYSEWIHKGGQPAWLVGAYALAYSVAHAVVCLRIALSHSQRWVRWVAIVSAFATGALITSIVAIDPEPQRWDESYWMWRVAAAGGLVCVSASLALAVLIRLNKRPVVQLRRAAYEQLTVVCPRCQRQGPLPVGGAICEGCKLHINITVSSTQCAQCGYDLTDLKAPACPECGTPVPRATAGMTESPA